MWQSDATAFEASLLPDNGPEVVCQGIKEMMHARLWFGV